MGGKSQLLVTGGAGYIGSHFIRHCGKKLPPIVVLDNLERGHRKALDSTVSFVKGDLKKPRDIEKVFKRFNISAVVHFAAYAEVPESVKHPLMYYQNNVQGALNLLECSVKYKVKRFLFSSTAATYGIPKKMPIAESAPQIPVNPYGASKLMFEKALIDAGSVAGMAVGILRYFNVAGALDDASLGEDHDPETHLIPNVLAAIQTKGKKLTVFGTDYPTRDGSCVRDYVHVQDLAQAHLLLYKHLGKTPLGIFNVGSQKGYSVLQIVKAVERVTGCKVPYKIGKKRAGDPPTLVADTRKIRRVLNWKPTRDLDTIISSAWIWHQNHPNGFKAKGSGKQARK